ncbi:MAG: hypothetical protein CJBNEKGG_02606 [Prosthecobacter sp.]|nr:hypothetical protein [Prosthecobacter sp.]
METPSSFLEAFRRPTWWRDVTFAALAGVTMLMPCYAGIPDWWINRGVVAPSVVPDHKAALTAGEFKNAVRHAVAEMNERLAGSGGAGEVLNNLIAAWIAEGAEVDNHEMVNAGQVKAVLKLWYDRLNAVHGTSGYPWPVVDVSSNYEAVNAGQLKKLLQIDVRLPWNQNIAQGYGVTAQPNLNPPAGAMSNQHAIFSARDHHSRNALLGLNARGGNPVALPPGAESIPSVPVATSAGEFKVGQDGSASYSIRLQGPKGVANVEPAISLDYNSGGGDGIVGLGWNLSGLSVINRGPASLAVDGYYDPADLDDNDRFYLDGERLVCVAGAYGADGSEYRTLKEQFSRIIYHQDEDENWFEVKTKSGLTMEFGHCNTSCIGPKENGSWCEHPRMTWAVCKVRDSLGNYWRVQYADLSPGGDAGENTPYLPDYQPSVISYTGHQDGRAPMHEIRLHYEPRPDPHRNYLMGFLVRRTQRLRAVEMLTQGTAVRAWRLGYNIRSNDSSARTGERSCLVSIQEVAGAAEDSQAPALPASIFTWDAGQRAWEGASMDAEQTLEFQNGRTPWGDDSGRLQLEHPLISISYGMPKGAQYVDLDGDGKNEILFNHRGPLLVNSSDSSVTLHDYRQVLRPSLTVPNRWVASFLPGVDSATPRQYLSSAQADGVYLQHSEGPGVAFSVNPRTTAEFPYLSTAANVPTGASLVDINGDGLPDLISSGTFDQVAMTWSSGSFATGATGRVKNATGVWINQGGNFVKDLDGLADTVVDHDENAATPLQLKDRWGAWALPRVPCEFTSSDGGSLVTRPVSTSNEPTLNYLRALGIITDPAFSGTFTLPPEHFSGANEVMGCPQLAQFREHDLGWRFVDMDGDGDMDIIRAGQGLEASGWLSSAAAALDSEPQILGTGPVSARGRQLCFGLRNNGPDAPPGQRWTLINPVEADASGSPTALHLKSIWKLPLPLVDDDGRLDMGRRLIDLNGDGLPDFIAQKKRVTHDMQAPWTLDYFNDYDLEVWINRGQQGWEHGGDAWRLEGHMISWLTATGAYDIDYGRMLQDMNGDGMPDFVVSMLNVGDGIYQLQEGVFLNHGKGWVKKLDPATGRNLPVNHVGLVPPKPLFYNRVAKPYSLMDLTGDGRPEFLNGSLADGVTLPGGAEKFGQTQFLGSLDWQASFKLSTADDWNLSEDLLASSTVPLNFTELNGDGALDILRSNRTTTPAPGYSSTYLRRGLFRSPRITRIINGLGVPMDITYGSLPQLAGSSADHHYRPAAPVADPLLRSVTPPATVVTQYTTLDGTELADGAGGGSITTSYYYAGLKSHAIHGSLGFESMETRTTLSPLRQITYFSQDWTTDTVGMPLGGQTYQVVNGQSVLISESSTSYRQVNMEPALEVPGKFSRLTYAHTVTHTNWSPEGVYMGRTVSVSGYSGSGGDKGLLTSQVVTLDQGTAADFSDDTSSSTVHEYFPPATGGGQWRIGQIRKTTLTSNAAGTPSVQKVSVFDYHPEGSPAAGMLKTETIDPETSFAVTKEHVYDTSGNEVKTLTRAPGQPTLVSETWFSADGRFPVASVNALGHATVTTYDPVKSLATSATLAFQGPVPSAGTGHSSTPPGAPSGTLSTSTSYDPWATARVSTAADGLRSVRYAMYFVDKSLPRALYYVYEQTEGSPPVITYYDRYHRALLVEKTGFGGEAILQEKQYDAKGRPVRVSKPYLAGAETPAYTVEEFDLYDRKTKVTAPDGSFVTITYNGFESTMTNHRGQAHKRRADMSERVVSSTDTDQNVVTFAYTADGQPRSSTTAFEGGDSPGTTITTTYNAQRLKESVTDPNTGTSWTVYDAFGRTQATKDSRNTWTVFEYDVLGRTTRRWTGVGTYNPLSPAPPTVYETLTETAYDTAPGFGLGKPASVSFHHKDGAKTRIVTETYAYDSLGRPTGTTATLSGQEAFDGTYSSSTVYHPSGAPGYGRTATVTDPGGFTRASVYNSLGFLAEVHEGSSGGPLLWSARGYDAEGRLLEEHHGNGVGTRNRYHPTRGFLESSQTFRVAGNTRIQDLDLSVNDLGNVEWRRLTRYESVTGARLGVPQSRTETFTFDSQNRLTSSYVVGQALQTFTFAANGNIMSKGGVGGYSYGASAGPHAVTGVTFGGEARSYTYDEKGRMKEEFVTAAGSASKTLLRQIQYTSFDQPQSIQHWRSAALSSDLGELGEVSAPWDRTCTMQFYFGPGLQRLIQVKHKGLLRTRTLSLGGYEIRETTRGSAGTLVEKEERSSFGSGTRVKRWTATQPEIPLTVYEYSAEDHLGSDSTTFDGQGKEQMQRGHLKGPEVQKSERQSYDAWGARRDGDTWAPAKGPLGESNASEEEREGSNLAGGFTGHQMLDDVGLVHMNGRLYDPALGRMCAADPYVQTPENLQNYNRYSYVLNNPLSQVDPSGHFIVEAIVAIVAAVLAVIGAVIATVVAFVAYLAVLAAQFVVTVISAVGQALGAMGSALMSAAKAGVAYVAANLTMGKVLLGAALGAIYNGAQVAINGGSFSQILKAAALGAVTGAVGAVLGAFLHGFGEAIGGELAGAGLGKAGGEIAGKVVHAAAHGAVGGGMSAAQGGSFKDGFIGSLIGTGVGVATGYAFGGVMNDIGIVGRTAVATISGGTASALTGGKFADGAYSAAFMHLFMTELGQKAKTRTVKTYDQTSNMKQQQTALRTAFDLIGKVWNLPNTVIGFAWGGVGFVAEIMMYPFTLSWNFRVSLGYNAVQFEGHNLAGTAETLGNTISYADLNGPLEPIRQEGHTIGQHEMMHTYQGQQLGVLYLPAVLISYGLDFVLSGPSSMFHGPWSFMERGPQTFGRNRPWNFSRDYVSPY